MGCIRGQVQIVYISNRDQLLRETLEYVKHFMPYIDEVVVVCPDDKVHDFSADNGFKTIVIPESRLLRSLGVDAADLSDHQLLNWALRSGLPEISEVADEFIMSDDDYRPLCPTDLSVFQKDGKYRAYYFFEMERWPNFLTDYDLGQHTTAEVLTRCGYPTLSYSSHMPQIINKSILRAARERFREYRFTPLDEWSVYFNFARQEFGNRFHPPERYRTICWTYPLPTLALSRPSEPLFENFYPGFYADGIFAGLSTTFSPSQQANVSREKLSRCHSWQLRSDVKRLLLGISRRIDKLHLGNGANLRIGADDYRFEIAGYPRVLLGRAASCVPIHLSIRNEGRALDQRELGLGAKSLRLGYRLLNGSGGVVEEGLSERRGAYFPKPVCSLDYFELDFLVDVPARAGRFWVELGLVREGRFHDVDSSAGRMRLLVV